jgi:hypothetical protein
VWASFRASRRRDRSTFEELAVLEGSEIAVVEKKSERATTTTTGMPNEMNGKPERVSRSASTHLRLLLAAFLVGGELPGVRLCGRARAWGALGSAFVRGRVSVRRASWELRKLASVAGFGGFCLEIALPDVRLHPP